MPMPSTSYRPRGTLERSLDARAAVLQQADKLVDRLNNIRRGQVCLVHVFKTAFIGYPVTSLANLRHQEICISLIRGARKPNLQGVITHASHLCSQRSFGLPLRMNGMHITQFDHARLDLLLLVI